MGRMGEGLQCECALGLMLRLLLEGRVGLGLVLLLAIVFMGVIWGAAGAGSERRRPGRMRGVQQWHSPPKTLQVHPKPLAEADNNDDPVECSAI
jgi:hypothetical protein